MTDEQHWRRRGLLFTPSGQRPWLQSHAQNPIAMPLDGSRHRLLFASRDVEQRAHIASVDLDLDDPAAEVEIGEQPALAPGPIGCFDDCGVYPGSVVSHEGRLWLYYIGVSVGRDAPLFYAAIGLAASDDGGRSFERLSRAPVFDRSDQDPCLVTGPMVSIEDGRWRLWYVSGFRWERKDGGGLTSWYHVKHAESDDGIEWRRGERVCIDHGHEGERNIARPSIIRDGDTYKAWYSYAGDFPYRLGYAESADGLAWTRRDELAVLEPPAQDWDSDAQAYPWVFDSGGARHMLYCGNEIGREGVGLATLD